MIRKNTESGNVLILLLGAVFALAILGTAVFELTDAARDRSLKLADRDRAVSGIEFGMVALRQTVAQEFESQGWVDVANLGGDLDQGTGALGSAYYNVDLETQDGPEQIFATQLHNTTLESLSAPDDPFHGASAVVTTFTVTANAQSTINSSDTRFNLPALQLTPQMSVRQIPVSEFTLFSSATSLTLSQSGDSGRIHSEGDLIISGPVSSLYPVTASGNISLGDNGALVVQPDLPGLAPLSFPFESTTNNAWLALARSTYRSTILSGRDLPMSMVQAAGIALLTARTQSGATPMTAQELWRQCNRVVLEAGGKLSVYNAAGAQVTGEEAQGFSGSGGPEIIFDLSKEPPAPGRNSFYIASSNPNAVVVLVNGSSLPGDLSVISPHAITVEGGFNTQGRAVSIVSGASVTAIPGPANGTAVREGTAPGRGLWAWITRPMTMSLARIGERALVLSTQAAAGFQQSLLGRFIPGGLERLWPAFPLGPQAQSGGDGGGGSGDGGGSSDGSSSDGSSSDGDGDGTSSSSDSDSDAAAAAAAANAAAEAAAEAQDAPANTVAAVTTDQTAVTNNTENDVANTIAALTDPVAISNAIQSEAITDPRGGAAPSSFDNGGAPLAAAGPVGPGAGAPPPAAPVDIAINAVIVSGANSPWGAVQRGSGVRNMTVTGGIVALGNTPLAGEPPPGTPQPAWLRLIPDPRLLDGSVIPPVVPNLIDIRWLNCPIQVVENPNN
jgi:hypothetical protein